MAEAVDVLLQLLIPLLEPVRGIISKTPYKPPRGETVSLRTVLESLLPSNGLFLNSPILTKDEVFSEIRKFSMYCALLVSAENSNWELMKWVPEKAIKPAKDGFKELEKVHYGGMDCVEGDGKRLVVELVAEVCPERKGSIKESAIDRSDDVDQVSAACAKAPVAYAIVPAYQFRWFVTQVGFPDLGKLCALVIPCALTALDHWSPEVKEHGMITFTHPGKNVYLEELSWCQDVILDACLQNIVSNDEIWQLAVEMWHYFLFLL